MNDTLKIIFQIWDLEEQWDYILEPEVGIMGNMTFNRLETLEELERVVKIQDEIKLLKRELRQKIGLWNYIKYSLDPLKYVQKLRSHNNKR